MTDTIAQTPPRRTEESTLKEMEHIKATMPRSAERTALLTKLRSHLKTVRLRSPKPVELRRQIRSR